MYNLRMDQVFDITRSYSPAETSTLQQSLAQRIITRGRVDRPRFIAGVDVSIDRISSTGQAAVVTMQYPGFNIVDQAVETGIISFPYIPGLLSFREMPLIIKAFNGLKIIPDLVIADGHGFAHPRRIGIASHLGLFTGLLVIGGGVPSHVSVDRI